MKKIYTFILGAAMLTTVGAKAQNVLMSMDFNDLGYDTTAFAFLGTDPSLLGNTTDTTWYVYDGDGLADGSGAGRPDAWYFSIGGFADVDTYLSDGVTDNIVMVSNSWFSSPAAAANMLITPSVNIGAHDTLFFKHASYQMPRYLDGFKVLISTTDNQDATFTTAHAPLFTAAEMTSILGTNDSVYSGYSFSSGFVHGMDGTFTEYHADSARLRGVLKPWRIALDSAGYANQKVFFCFYHDSFDDNLISVDDIMVRGTMGVGVPENTADISLNIYPNPATDIANITYTLTKETNVVISVYDVTGKLIANMDKGMQSNGYHSTGLNTGDMAKGFYTMKVTTDAGITVKKLIVK